MQIMETVEPHEGLCEGWGWERGIMPIAVFFEPRRATVICILNNNYNKSSNLPAILSYEQSFVSTCNIYTVSD